MKKILALVAALMMLLCSVSALAEGGLYLGSATVTSVADSTDATAEADGKIVAYTHVASVVVDENGVISAALIDAIQAQVKVNAEGKITSDKEAPVLSKNEKLEGYGMKGVSPIGKEWYEQMEGLENWLVGKTVADLKAAIEGKDETLLAVCTVSMDEIVEVLEKAVNMALLAK